MQCTHSGGLDEDIVLDINKRKFFHLKNGRRCKRGGKTAILQHINALITYYCDNMISRETETANMGFTGDKCI